MNRKKLFASNRVKKNAIIITLTALAVLATGCISLKKNTPVQSGVFKSLDRGQAWTYKNLLVVTGGLTGTGSINVTGLYFDPQDNNAVYMTAQSRGLFYSYNGGENWFQPPQLNTGNINSIAVDPKDKCIIYVAVTNRILKSEDCSRSFNESYIDSRNIAITSVAVSPENSLEIYAGTSKGEYFRSIDGARSWNTIFNHRSNVKQILIDPQDATKQYAVVNAGIFKSIDGGFHWEDLNKDLKKYSGAKNINRAIFNPSKQDSLLIASNYGIMKTEDGGTTWEPYSLITPPLSAKISVVAVNPRDDNFIYYATPTTFYKTEDGGNNWIVRRLPSAAHPTILQVDPINPGIIYLGTLIPSN